MWPDVNLGNALGREQRRAYQVRRAGQLYIKAPAYPDLLLHKAVSVPSRASSGPLPVMPFLRFIRHLDNVEKIPFPFQYIYKVALKKVTHFSLLGRGWGCRGQLIVEVQGGLLTIWVPLILLTHSHFPHNPVGEGQVPIVFPLDSHFCLDECLPMLVLLCKYTSNHPLNWSLRYTGHPWTHFVMDICSWGRHILSNYRA